MMKGTEETSGRYRRKLLHPLYNHRLVIPETDTPSEHIETIRDEDRVKAVEFRHCQEVFQGRQVDGFVQGCVERP